MKLLLLKILLQRRARDEGFTLPMVIALGLVMILLGTTNIVKSSEENIAAINQNSSSDALAIAEVGVARYREFLNQNRILTIYNQAQWSTLAGQTCNNIANTPPGWFDDDNAGTNVSPSSTSQWWEVKQNLADDSIGEYKLVSYVYDNDGNPADNDNNQFALNDDNANTTDSWTYNDIPYPANPNGYNPRGILTVQGRSSDGSEAQIQVDIPLRINDFDNLAPLLWVGSGSITNAGGTDKLNLSNGKIILSNPGGNCPNVADIDGNQVINDSRDLPDIINDPDGEALIPATGTTPEIPAVPAVANNKKNTINIDLDSADDELLLPRPNLTPDNQNDDGRFLYRTANNIVIDNNNLLNDGVAKVTLYVDSANIDIDNSVQIGNYNSNVSTGTVSSHNLEIYVDGNQTINIDTGISETVDIEAFIHAPDSSLNISGTGTVNINGAVWVANYNNSGGAEVNIRRDQTDTVTGSEAAYKFYTTSATRTARPLTSSPTNWVKEEVE